MNALVLVVRLAAAAAAAAVAAAAAPGAPAAPAAILIATSQGEWHVPVFVERGHPALAVPMLKRILPIDELVQTDWALVAFANQPFRFLLDAPVFVHGGRVIPVVGGAYVARDTLFVPLQWLVGHIPELFEEAYRYDPLAARFEEARLSPPVSGTRGGNAATRGPSALARRNGFRASHTVVVDAGHGGTDKGSPGLFLPRGVQEKHVTLAIAKWLQRELEGRGVDVKMTRTADRNIPIRDRAPMCRDDCDLFVSIHVNSLPRRYGYQRVNGVETYFLSEARTAEAERVARMENEALRYEVNQPPDGDDPLGFIYRDLHQNEYLRESALLADLVQQQTAAIHPGENRGVSQAGFWVLATAQRPAILVETGFATNRGDASFLASPEGQRRLAGAIADGIVDYLRAYDRKVLTDISR